MGIWTVPTTQMNLAASRSLRVEAVNSSVKMAHAWNRAGDVMETTTVLTTQMNLVVRQPMYLCVKAVNFSVQLARAYPTTGAVTVNSIAVTNLMS